MAMGQCQTAIVEISGRKNWIVAMTESNEQSGRTASDNQSRELKSHVAREAREMVIRANAFSERTGGPSYSNFVIQSYSDTDYHPVAFLKKTATEELYEELKIYLNQLYTINEEHVGEKLSDVNVYFALTGGHALLSDCLCDWTQRYFEARVRKNDPKDCGDPWIKYRRLLDEFSEITGELKNRVGYLIWYAAISRAHWCLFEATWKDRVRIERQGYKVCIAGVPSDREELAIQDIHQFKLGLDDLRNFVIKAEHAVPEVEVAELKKLDENELAQNIEDAAEDICEMRMLLARNFDPAKTIMKLSEDLVIACNWVGNNGVLAIFVAESERLLRENIWQNWSPYDLCFRRNGVLIESMRPWVSARTDLNHGSLDGLILNAFLIDRFRNKLLEFYDQIDFDRIRSFAANPEKHEDRDDEILAVACLDIAKTEPDQKSELPQKSRNKRIQSHLSRDKFFRILVSCGCEKRSGKGDETTFYRSGGKKYAIGRPKEIQPTLIKRVLARLNITLDEFVRCAGTI